MMCEECGKAPATVHIERIINGRKMTMHLCRDCAQRSGLMTLGMLFQPSFSINSLMSAFLGSAGRRCLLRGRAQRVLDALCAG